MIKSGVVSVTFRNKSCRELVDITARAGLESIEWGSDVHVPAGDIAKAKEVRDMTVSAGLDVASYGSYYHIGLKQDFAPYLETAVALGAPNIRIWATKTPSKACDTSYWNFAAEDACRISEEAKKAGITVSTEYHGMSLTDTLESTLRLLDSVKSDNFYSYWQQPLFIKFEEQLPQMTQLLNTGKLSNVHVFTHYSSFPAPLATLEEGRDEWTGYFAKLNEQDVLRYALIEFVRDGSDESFMNDSAVLKELLAK